MKIQALLVFQCPHCGGDLKASPEQVQTEEISDPHAKQKCCSMRQRFGDAAILSIAAQLGWKAPESEEEWIQLLLLREIVSGSLKCVGCDRIYEIKQRIPVFVQ